MRGENTAKRQSPSNLTACNAKLPFQYPCCFPSPLPSPHANEAALMKVTTALNVATSKGHFTSLFLFYSVSQPHGSQWSTPYFPKHPPPLAYRIPHFPGFSPISLAAPSWFSWLGPPLLPNLSSWSAQGLFFPTDIHLYRNNCQMKSSCSDPVCYALVHPCNCQLHIFTWVPNRHFKINISNMELSLTLSNSAFLVS